MMNTVRRIRWNIIFSVTQSNRIPRAEYGFNSGFPLEECVGFFSLF